MRIVCSMSVTNTPMMQQYFELREQYPDFLLFYRMGDFFELFGDDALVASEVLQITLTRRKTAKDGDEGIPMCGVPHHAAEGYIAKLLECGFKVALCEQTETPEQAKKRGGSKALVKREVTRLYTGGTLTEDSMLEAARDNYLLALAANGQDIALAWLDLSNGQFEVTSVAAPRLDSELARLNPAEIILDGVVAKQFETQLKPWQAQLTRQDSLFASRHWQDELCRLLKVATLESFGFQSDLQEQAAYAAVQYAHLTQLGKLPALQHPKVLKTGHFLQLDAATRQNLELTQTLQGQRKGSLLHIIDHTATAAGARLLSNWLSAPLTDVNAIHARQDAIRHLSANPQVRKDLHSMLAKTADLNRALSRLTLGRGGPRDLHAIRATLKQLPTLADTVCQGDMATPDLLYNATSKLAGFDELACLLDRALEEDNLPMQARDGGFIRHGFDARLDEQMNLAKNGKTLLQELECNEAERTGISSLRIKYNKVWGYFIEVTKTNAGRVPEDYVHRQTTTNAQRFSTAKLMELERDLSAAQSQLLNLEMETYAHLVDQVNTNAPTLRKAAESLAYLDVLACGAILSEKYAYNLPTIDNSNAFHLEEARHPVVAQTVDEFIANDCDLSGHQLWLITGPNMAGKSTFLRQNALITILAQMGLPVPAERAHIGVVDRIFTRIGASDNLAKGQSTFMVEMVETAAILNGATEHSLVILDEIGRGTATYDGLAIAWSCVEHLVSKTRCRGLFATHYHELTSLAEAHTTLKNHHAAVKEWDGRIVFLHSIKPGAAPRSYGIHVAKLAGLPPTTVRRAEQILKQLETSAPSQPTEMPLFAAPDETPAPLPSPLEEKLLEISLDDMTPRQAQDVLYELRTLMKEN